MGPIGCPEISVRNFFYSLRNNPDEGSSHTSLLLKYDSLMKPKHEALAMFQQKRFVFDGHLY